MTSAEQAIEQEMNPPLKYDSTITLGNIISAASGLITIGILWGIQSSANLTFKESIGLGVEADKAQDAQMSAIKENASIQRENTALIKQDLSYVKDIVLEIRSEQNEAKRHLDK